MLRLYSLINLLLKVFNAEAYPLINLSLKVFNAEAVSSNQPRKKTTAFSALVSILVMTAGCVFFVNHFYV